MRQALGCLVWLLEFLMWLNIVLLSVAVFLLWGIVSVHFSFEIFTFEIFVRTVYKELLIIFLSYVVDISPIV